MTILRLCIPLTRRSRKAVGMLMYCMACAGLLLHSFSYAATTEDTGHSAQVQLLHQGPQQPLPGPHTEPTPQEQQDQSPKADQPWIETKHGRNFHPSPRNPNVDWSLNVAGILELHLQDDGHRTWGFVIYRTTYESTDEWQEFLRRLRFHMEKSFEFYGGLDLLEKFSLTIFDDPELFDGASTEAVREHFKQWAVDNWWQEQTPLQGESSGDDFAPRFDGVGRSQRYRFAVQVDAESLRSVVHDAPGPPARDHTKQGWVKLIDGSWYPGRSKKSDDYEPIEGVTEKDVGWAKVPYQNVMAEYYVDNRGPNMWRLQYRRPPQVAVSPWRDADFELESVGDAR